MDNAHYYNLSYCKDFHYGEYNLILFCVIVLCAVLLFALALYLWFFHWVYKVTILKWFIIFDRENSGELGSSKLRVCK